MNNFEINEKALEYQDTMTHYQTAKALVLAQQEIDRLQNIVAKLSVDEYVSNEAL